MACIRKRRGKWVVDYRDAVGARRWVTCETRAQADAALEGALRESRQPMRPVVDPNITLAAYSQRWLGIIPANLKRATVESYSATLRLHLLPVFGHVRLRLLQRGQIQAFLAHKLMAGLSRGTVRILHATLRAMLNAAVDDGAIAVNPANRLGRQLRLAPSPSARQETIKAMTREQLAAFLAAATGPDANDEDRRGYPLMLTMARTGMRLGEALALQWADLDLDGRSLRVERAFSGGRIETPKSGHGRPGVRAPLEARQAARPLLAPLPPSLLRVAAAPTGRERRLRAAPARARVDQTHGRHLWKMAADGQQGRRGSPGRRER